MPETSIPKVVLGLKLGPQHDTGAALVVDDGTQLLCVALSEERLTREKQCRKFPQQSIQVCLESLGLSLSDVDLICVDKLQPKTHTLTHRLVESIDTEVWSSEELEFFRRTRGKRFVVNHHLAHAATAFCVHDLRDAVCLVVDGSGTHFPLEQSTDRFIDMGGLDCRGQMGFQFRERRAETQSVFEANRDANGRVHFHRKAVSTRSGCGHFYSFFTRHCLGFEHLQEGKSMGLAAWGDPVVANQFPAVPESVYSGIDTPILEYLKDIQFEFRKRNPEVCATDSYFAGFAQWMQNTLGDAMMYLARFGLGQSSSRNLCLAGGVALNVVNNRIIRETLTSEGQLGEMFVQPASSDAGMPLGNALYGYYVIGGGTKPFQKNIVYLGPERELPKSENLLLSHGGHRSENLAADVASLLMKGKIVGWVQGRSEYGPRALGARSILCWPRPKYMKDHLNLRVKHREAFRPFAPIIAEERASQVFDVDFPVPYMLFNTRIRSEYLDRLPAVAHVDGSGRLQTVSKDGAAKLHDLLEEIYRRDGVGVLLNTSFNDAGEPIVETAEDAYDCYERTGLDALVIGDIILVRQPRPLGLTTQRLATPEFSSGNAVS